MLKVRRSVGFEYVLAEDGWQLVDALIDQEVAKILGPAMLEYPRVICPPSSPQHLLGKLFLALAVHKLDGGYVHEELDERRYRVTIIVDERREKPSQGNKEAS